MKLPRPYKPKPNRRVKLPVCPFCNAVGKHYGYQCPQNPKNKCSYCDGTDHTSLMCQRKPRKPIKQESEKTYSRRTETSREWFKLNPPDGKGVWICYLQISPECPIKLTRSTIRLEHKKSKARHPELKYDTNNIGPACDPCNKLKGSLNDDELHLIGSIKTTPDAGGLLETTILPEGH